MPRKRIYRWRGFVRTFDIPDFSRSLKIFVLLVEEQKNGMRIEQKLVSKFWWYGLVAPLRMIRKGLGGQCGVLTLPNSPCDLLGLRRLQRKDLIRFGGCHIPAWAQGDAIRLVDHARPHKLTAINRL